MSDQVAAELARRLSGVPAFTPKLVQLAWELCLPDGELDMERAGQLAVELRDALSEANTYNDTVRDLLWRLQKL